MHRKTHLSLLLSAALVPGLAAAQTNTFPSSGNVGIGTTSPAYSLDIQGTNFNTIRAYGSSSNSIALTLANTTTSGDSWSLFSSGGGPAPVGDFGIYDNNGSVSRLVINPSGDVGIGTTTPSALLEVRQDTSSQTIGGRVAINNFASVSNAAVSVDMSDTNIGSSDPQTRIEAIDNADWSANLIFLTKVPGANTNSLAERMRISSSGNVGIGTTAPSYPLSVNGTIEAKEVLVQAGWSDFVFDKAYRLPPLAEVEQSIAKDKHLPGMPSAGEVASHGVSVGEMDAKLLQKIEELTLYTIQLQKENDALRERVTALEAKSP